MSELNDRLFILLKSHKIVEFKEIILNNPNLDLNITDLSDNYLIQYLVLYNYIELVQILLNRGCKVDIYDNDYRSILFNVIKYNYIKLLDVILKKESESIGISLLSYSDNYGLYPLHYAIMFNNVEAIKLILKYNININELDFNGDNYLMYSIKYKNNEIFNLILNKNPFIDHQTNTGETILHIACNFGMYNIVKMLLKKNINVNLADYKIQITPIFYSIIRDNLELFNLLINKSDLKIQDVEGNNILHYAIKEKNKSIINAIIDKIDDFNISNINGRLPLHLLLYLNQNKILVSNINYIKVINKTNLNILDNHGYSNLFLLVKFNIWKQIKKNLINKKLNGFILINNKNLYNHVDEKNQDEFLNLLTTSYINQIRTKNRNWKNNLDKLCKTKLSINKYNKLENKKIKFKKNIDDVCFPLIKNYILENMISLPIKIKPYDIQIYNIKDYNFVSYTGDIIDILFGLIYLKEKFKNITTTLSSEFDKNYKLKKFYLDNQKRQVLLKEFLNLEIIWINQNIFYPTILEDKINNFKKSNDRFLIIPLGIELSLGSHANILIYDKKLNEIERFEPHGSIYPYAFNYNPDLLDNLLYNYFNSFFDKIIYKKPSDFLPKLGFQYLENYTKTQKIGDPGGFCASWCTWYVSIRLTYPDVDRIKIINKIIRKIRQQNIGFKKVIRNFSKKITDIRDTFLNEIDHDINDWKNNQINENQIIKLIINIKNYISNFM